jgi:two-component system cell cycle sensor histidine kinase/response regulator CckA
MAHAAEQRRKRKAADLAAPAAGGFFLLAVLFAASFAFRAGPVTWAGVALLTGLTAVALIVLLAMRTPPIAAPEPDLDLLTGALSEPAAVVAADGAIESANAPWRAAVGPGARLGRTTLGSAYALLKAARTDGRAAQPVTIGDQGMRLEAASLLGGRFLIRLASAVAATPAVGGPAPHPGNQGLDAFAAASPFGAALIEGEDPFAGPILEVNAAWAAIAGGAPGNSSLGAVLTPESRDEAARRREAGGAGPFEVRPAARPDSIAHLYLAWDGGHTVAYLVDVTDQKQMQAQLAQSNKMQAIGQLAGGVAHDFNNLLTAIQLRLDELLLRHPLGDPSYEGLSEIRQTSIRAADLVRQLLTFSRKATIQRETLDLGELISNFEVLLRRLIREDVRLETDYGRNLPMVRADKAQLENAVMNLVVNARDAVRSKGGGTVTLKTARLTQAEAFGLGYGGAPMGEMALIEVADDGPGIAPDAMAKIFDPFFTTKPVGEGTGLGLATVYGIVKQSDGWITPLSKPGEGATFRIFLPVYEPPVLVEPPAPAAPRGRPAARDLSGAGRILFVEDEDAVRGVAARLLRARGYEVLEAADGEEALVIAEANAGQIDLMISDVIMPGIDGPTLLKKARGYLGTAPVMFISGYAEAEFSDLLEGESGVSFLPKPIDIKSLAERVKQQLQAA